MPTEDRAEPSNCQTISATVIALNEADNLTRCLKSLDFADEIILVDSGSTDETLEIARKFNVKIYSEVWRGYGAQKNFAMSHAACDWVLNVDADEEITVELKKEILAAISSPNSFDGYAIARKTFFLGKWIRHGGWFPNYVMRLCKRKAGSWTEPEVHEVLKISGTVGRFNEPMNHFTFKNLNDQILTNVKYARNGARQFILSRPNVGLISLVTLALAKPIGKFIETYFFKLGVLDGLRGFIISVNAAYSVFMKYVFALEEKFLGPI